MKSNTLKQMRTKKGAMEMSVGTIVTIVLLMSVLILGLFLVRNIFQSAGGAIDLTDSQLQNEISQIFGDEGMKSAVYPSSGVVEIKPGETDAMGIGIKNIPDMTSNSNEFRYTVKYDSTSKSCKIQEGPALQMLSLGSEGQFTIAPNDLKSTKVRIEVPEIAPPCMIRYVVNIYRGAEFYDSQFFDLVIKG